MLKACKNKCFREGRSIVLALFVVLFFAGCSGEVKVDPKFVETFVELRLVEISHGADSPISRLLRQDILKRYGYTREEYLAKMDKILADEDQWVPFQQAVNGRLDSLLAIPKKEDKAKPSSPKKGPPKTKKGSE